MDSQTWLKPKGLTWLAERDPDRWIHPKSKKLRITQIAKDAGIGRVSLHEMLRGNRKAGGDMQDRLRALAATTGVTRAYAHKQLFEDPAEAEKVAA